VAKDVCEVLEHSNSRVAIESLEDDEKGVSKVYTPGGTQDMTVISESGLYTLIMR
jgi:prophage antirepressor-like protein